MMKMIKIFGATSIFNFIKPGSCKNALPTCVGLRSYSVNVKTEGETKDAANSTGSPKFVDTHTKSHYRFIYPEFLPDPNMEYRHPIKEKIERQDMLKRRAHIDIPEFYVGSIMAVTTSDEHSPSKIIRFVGLCIDRGGSGLLSYFVLRNAIDNQGIEVKYESYDPTIQKIEVLLLEKRLDNQLYYLRDAPLEYSTFDENMDMKHHPEGQPVPVNPIQVTLRPRPWMQRWERKGLKGVKLDSINEHITDKMRAQIQMRAKPWEEYDLMLHYRKTIPEEEQNEIYNEIDSQLSRLRKQRQIVERSKKFVRPKKAN